MRDQKLSVNTDHNLILSKAIKSKLWLSLITITLFVSGCTESTYSQCEKFFDIARSMSENNQNLDGSDRQTPEENKIKSGLSIADAMKQAANDLTALKIDRAELIDYRNKLVTIYNIYAQATLDAVKAQEDKNIEILQAARKDAIKAGKMQQNLVNEINILCTSNY